MMLASSATINPPRLGPAQTHSRPFTPCTGNGLSTSIRNSAPMQAFLRWTASRHPRSPWSIVTTTTPLALRVTAAGRTPSG